MGKLKKVYLAPETEEVEVALEKCVLQTLSDSENYGNGGEGIVF
jgi:hypothetical protein